MAEMILIVTRRRVARRVLLLILFVISSAACADRAVAQTAAGDKRDTGGAKGPTSLKRSEVKRQPIKRRASKSSRKGAEGIPGKGPKSKQEDRRPGTGVKSRSSHLHTISANPDSKWSCKNAVVTLEPVWRGASTMTFEFFIKNEGTADLQIRAKGG